MTRGKATNGLDFEALRLGIERCDPELVLGFYADDAELSIVHSETPQNPPFELRGKVEIAKHLRAVFGQKASHRVEREVVGEDRVTFREACEYPDGGWVWVETTLEVGEDKIVRQVEVVSAGTQPDHEDDFGELPPTRRTQSRTHPGVNAPSPDRLLRSKQETE